METSLQECNIESIQFHTIQFHGLCHLVVKYIHSLQEESFGWVQEIEMYNIVQATPRNIVMYY